MKVIRKCLICIKEFKVWPSVIKKEGGIFCSRKCRGIFERRKIFINCYICHKKFETIPSRIKKGNRFCSRQCNGKWYSKNMNGRNSHLWKGGEIIINCPICKKIFFSKPSDKRRFCSLKCRGKWQEIELKREKSSNWQGGITPINTQIRNSKKYIQWAKLIKERDNYICQICRIRGGILRSNHIKKFSDYPILRFNLSNGITICKDCDTKFIMWHEEECVDFFIFNLIERGYL